MAPHLPNTITVKRGVDGATRIEVDGEPLPWFTSATDPVSIDITTGQPSGVRVTLLAASVRVVDDVMADAATVLEHTHDGDKPAADPVAPAAAAVASEHGVVSDDKGSTWRRCAADCTLKAIAPGRAVCDENTTTCPAVCGS